MTFSQLEGVASRTSRVTVRADILVALPVLTATLLVLAFAVSEILGHTPLSYAPPQNIAEAAGMGIASEVLRMLRQGQDVNQIMQVRPDIISSAITRVTALEAAIWSRRVELVRMLDREGAIRGDHVRRQMACLARHLRTEDILAHLAPAGLAGCDPDGTIRSIEARSQ